MSCHDAHRMTLSRVQGVSRQSFLVTKSKGGAGRSTRYEVDNGGCRSRNL